MTSRHLSQALQALKSHGIRPTRQRLALARLLEKRGHCHITAEDLYRDARDHDIDVSLATVYNSLHQFTDAGLLREVIVDLGQSYFDTNVSYHHHFYDESTGRIWDIPADSIELSRLPEPPEGAEIDRVEVVVRLRTRN